MDNTNEIKQKGQTSFKSRRLKRKSEVSSFSLHVFQSVIASRWYNGIYKQKCSFGAKVYTGIILSVAILCSKK